MLKHASRSRHIDPDRPPAAAGGLRSQVPDLVHGPPELLDCRQLCSRLVDENGPAPLTGGRGRASTWQLQLLYWAVRATYDAARPTTSVDPAWGLFLPGRPHRVASRIAKQTLSVYCYCGFKQQAAELLTSLKAPTLWFQVCT